LAGFGVFAPGLLAFGSLYASGANTPNPASVRWSWEWRQLMFGWQLPQMGFVSSFAALSVELCEVP